MTILEHISLARHTTFHIGGPARFFVQIKSVDDLRQATAFARDHRLPMLILGGGSNVLVNDEGFAGVVAKMEIGGMEFREIDPSEGWRVELVAGAGVVWDEAVAHAVDRGLQGLENLSCIPGTVGAAPIQNIGAYGCEVQETLSWVEALDLETGQLRRFTNPECEFAYRHSFFKTPAGRKYGVVKVAFALRRHGEINTSYKELAQAVQGLDPARVTAAQVRKLVIDIRRRKLPDPAVLGTAGSFFKNPILARTQYDQLLDKFPGMPHFPVDERRVKVPAAWLLDKVCGFKGHRDGAVGVYQNQALVLVNFAGGTAGGIKQLAARMAACVREKTGITLEREVQYV